MILQSLIVEMGLNIANLRKDFNYATREVEKFTTGATRAFKGLGMGIGAYLGGRQIIDFGKQVFQTGLEIQRLEYAFIGITGSAHGAAQELDYLLNVSRKLGLDFMIVAQGYKNISAASMQTSIEGQGVRDIFYAVSEAGVALGLSGEAVSSTLYALEQMISKGVVSMEEIRRQLQQLPGSFNMAAKAMNMSTREFNKFIKEGNLLTDEFMPKFAKVVHDRFEIPAKLAARNAQQEVNRFRTEWTLFKKSLGDTGFFDFVTNRIRNLTTAFNFWTQAMQGSKDAWEKLRSMKTIPSTEDLNKVVAESSAQLKIYQDRLAKLKANIPAGANDLKNASMDTRRWAAEVKFLNGEIQTLNNRITEMRTLLKTGKFDPAIVTTVAKDAESAGRAALRILDKQKQEQEKATEAAAKARQEQEKFWKEQDERIATLGAKISGSAKDLQLGLGIDADMIEANKAMLEYAAKDYYKYIADQREAIIEEIEYEFEIKEAAIDATVELMRRGEERMREERQRTIEIMQSGYQSIISMAGGAPGAENVGAAYLGLVNMDTMEGEYQKRIEASDSFWSKLIQQAEDANEKIFLSNQWAAEQSILVSQKEATMRLNSYQFYAQGMMGFTDILNTFLSKESLAMFAIQKAIAVAQILIQAKLAAMAAYAQGMIMGGPLAAEAAMARAMTLGYVMAAATAATAIGQIVSGKIGAGAGASGGTSGTSASTTTTTTATPIVEAQRPMSINIYVQGSLYGTDKDRIARELMAAIRKAEGDGAR